VIPLEYPRVRARCVDITQAANLDGLLAEIEHARADRLVALRGRHRFLPVFDAVRLDAAPAPHPRLREGGVYVITGGFGGMGLSLAAYLARAARARLVLLGRSGPPPREAWTRHLEGEGSPAERAVIEKILALEALGAEVLTARVDVTNAAELAGVLAEARRRFGPISGVIHAAGVADFEGVIHARTRPKTDAVMAPKVQGTLLLDGLLRDDPLDFVVLCSTLGSVLYHTKFGQVGYAAANEFLDAFAIYRAARGDVFTVAINWDDWAEVGMTVGAMQRRGLSDPAAIARLSSSALSPDEGAEVFARVLAGPPGRVLVSVRDLRRMMEIDPESPEAILSASRVAHARPALSNAYVAPDGEIERTIASILQDTLGVDRVGRLDDFFELGGHSLLATQLMARLRDTYGVELSLRDIFDAPTVERLSGRVESARRTRPFAQVSDREPAAHVEEGEI
jgi:NAD(P)-dependent dehydrogenase (short-subunit alcohol dehydrogenase family)